MGLAAIAVATALAVLSFATATPSQAFSIELKGAAPDRIERQRNEALGRLPLPGTPDLARRDERLAAAGVKLGDEVFIRIFKASSELELWMRKGDRFVKFATYPICFWSGTLGPKLVEGDMQTPEGLYTVTRRQLHWSGRHPRSLNLGFPNAFDKANDRTGSYILVHGSCSSVGCYAMTNVVVDEIFTLAEAALRKGQTHIHVHAFPFRMTDAALAEHILSPWYGFWRSLKPAHDAFEATHMPPTVAVCGQSYAARATQPGEDTPGPLAVCRVPHSPDAAAILATAPVSLPHLPLPSRAPSRPGTSPSPLAPLSSTPFSPPHQRLPASTLSPPDPPPSLPRQLPRLLPSQAQALTPDAS